LNAVVAARHHLQVELPPAGNGSSLRTSPIRAIRAGIAVPQVANSLAMESLR
jgi:hypothetical protein